MNDPSYTGDGRLDGYGNGHGDSSIANRTERPSGYYPDEDGDGHGYSAEGNYRGGGYGGGYWSNGYGDTHGILPY